MYRRQSLHPRLYLVSRPSATQSRPISFIKGNDSGDCGGDSGSATLNCRDGYPCTIECGGSESCGAGEGGSVTINCNGATICTLMCDSSAESCARRDGSAVFNCDSSACKLQCDGNCGSRLTKSYSCIPTGNCNNVNDPDPFTADPTTSPSQSPITSDPTFSPSEPSKDPSTTPTRSPITSDPSLSPSRSPSKQPTKAPSNQPSAAPSLIPSTNPSISPKGNPNSSPSSSPTQSPIQLTLIPSKSPLPEGETYSPSEDPSFNPTQEEDGAVDVITTDFSGSIQSATAKLQKEGVGNWLYIVIGCGSMICCLGIILLLYKYSQKRKSERNLEDKFRFDANKGNQQRVQLNAFLFLTPLNYSFHVCINPKVHNQVNSASANSPDSGEGGINTGSNMLRLNSTSTFDEDNDGPQMAGYLVLLLVV